jgi:hypothetical protein
MIVHEALPPVRVPRLNISLEHHYIRRKSVRRDKDAFYALLWAIQQSVSGKRASSPRMKGLARFFKDWLVGGAALRGGVEALETCASVARSHALRYELLRRARAGEFQVLTDLYVRGELEQLVGRTRQLANTLEAS